MILTSKIEEKRVVSYVMSLKSIVPADNIATLVSEFTCNLIHEQKASILSKVGWGLISMVSIQQSNNAVAVPFKPTDLHFDPQNKNIFCVS